MHADPSAIQEGSDRIHWIHSFSHVAIEPFDSFHSIHSILPSSIRRSFHLNFNFKYQFIPNQFKTSTILILLHYLNLHLEFNIPTILHIHEHNLLPSYILYIRTYHRSQSLLEFVLTCADRYVMYCISVGYGKVLWDIYSFSSSLTPR